MVFLFSGIPCWISQSISVGTRPKSSQNFQVVLSEIPLELSSGILAVELQKKHQQDIWDSNCRQNFFEYCSKRILISNFKWNPRNIFWKKNHRSKLVQTVSFLLKSRLTQISDFLLTEQLIKITLSYASRGFSVIALKVPRGIFPGDPPAFFPGHSWNFSQDSSRDLYWTFSLRCYLGMSLRVSLGIPLEWFSAIPSLEIYPGIILGIFAGFLPKLGFLLVLHPGFLQNFFHGFSLINFFPKLFQLLLFLQEFSWIIPWSFPRDSPELPLGFSLGTSLIRLLPVLLTGFFSRCFSKVPSEFSLGLLQELLLIFLCELFPRFLQKFFQACPRVAVSWKLLKELLIF